MNIQNVYANDLNLNVNGYFANLSYQTCQMKVRCLSQNAGLVMIICITAFLARMS
jgi:hypothetical protein